MLEKNLLILIIFTSFLLILSCDNEDANQRQIIRDTILVEKAANTTNEQVESKVLKGTTVLTASEKNMESRWVHGLYLSELISSDCLRPESETPTPTEITSIKQLNDTTLVITANISANCGYSFLGEIEILSDDTINLIYHGYGDYAMCDCCFGLTYRIDIFKDDKHQFNKLKYVTINGHAKEKLPKFR